MTGEFRFYRYSQRLGRSEDALEPFLEDIPRDLINAYCAQEKWTRLPHLDWRLGVLVEWHTDFSRVLSPKAVAAIACALDVYGFARDELRLHQAILLRARSEILDGHPLSWREISEMIGISLRTLNNWKSADLAFAEKLAQAKSAMCSGLAEIIGPRGLDYPGSEWLDVEEGQGWKIEAPKACQRIIDEMRREYARDHVARYAPATLRKRIYTIARWYADHDEVLPPIAVEALAYVIGYADDGKSSGPPRHKSELKKAWDLSILAKADAKAIQQYGSLPLARAIARHLDLSHVTVGHMRKNSPNYKRQFDQELARLRS